MKVSINPYNAALEVDSGTNSWLGIELWADDANKAQRFYETTFSVTTEKITVDNKPYWHFKSGNRVVAGMAKNPVTNQSSQWVPYLKVNSPAAIVTATKEAGGEVILSPTPSIRNGKLAIIQDPHGALIAVQQ